MTHQELIWRAFQAGEIDAAELTHLQALTRPVCACGRPAVPLQGERVCVECFAVREGARLPSGDNREVWK